MKRLIIYFTAIFSLLLITLIATVLKLSSASNLPEEIRVNGKIYQDSSIYESQIDYEPDTVSYAYQHRELAASIQQQPLQEPNLTVADNSPPYALYQTSLLVNFAVIILLLIVGLGILAFLLLKNYQVRKDAQKSEQRFKALLTASPSAILIFQNYKLRYVNAAMESITGFTHQELLNMEVWQLIHPDSLKSFDKSNVSLETNGFNFKGEFQLITKSKDIKWVYLTTRTIEFDNSPAVLATAIDITDKKEYEKQLIEAEERYSLIVLASNDGIFDLDITTQELYLSDQWRQMLGYDTKDFEASRENWLSLIHHEDQQATRHLFDKLQSGEIPGTDSEYRMLCADGSYKWVKASFAVVYDDKRKPIRILGTHADVTKRKVAEQKLKESEQRYKSFFASNSAIMLMLNPQSGSITNANQAALDFYGYDKDTFSEMNLSQIKVQDPQINTQTADQIDHQEDKTFYYDQHRLADGRICDVEVYTSQVEMGDKKVEYAIIFDITQRRKMEKELKKARDEAEEANRVKSFFVSNLSHEIRTPLNAIIGLTNLVIQEQDHTDEQMENMRSIKYSSDHLLGVINDVLDFSKLEAGKVELEKTDFNIYNLVKDSVKTIEYKAREKGIALNVSIDPSIPRILKGDPSRLRQILLNLLSNAIKFTPQGHIDVKAELIDSTEENAGLKFSVSDTGIGIPEDKQKSLFQTYIQAESDTSRKFGGTGLGLSICKKLVELQHGKIGLKSIEGMGSTFWFSLNFQISEKTFLPEMSKAAGQFSTLKGVDILLVEDDKMNQFVMERILKKWDAKLEIAGNGQEAIHMLEKKKYHVVLMDLHMPKLNGYEATRIIRNPESKVLDHNVPVIALTADVTSETRERVKNAGMNDFLTKPSDNTIIYQKIMQALANSKTEFVEKKEAAHAHAGDQEKLHKAKLRIKKALADIFDDDLEGTLALIKRFLKEIPKTIVGINDAFYDQEYESLSKMVHKIKPGYSYMGFSEVSDKINRIQELARSRKDIQQLEKLCNELDDDSREIIRILREIQKEYLKDNSVNIS